MRRKFMKNKKELVLHTQRFYPSGNYTWTVPAGCTEVDVFLVGGGGAGNSGSGGGGGYTKTFKSSTSGWRDGGAVSVVPGQVIQIIVGAGGKGSAIDTSTPPGGYSQFMNSSYRANGGEGAGHNGLSGPAPYGYTGGNGGSGGSADSNNSYAGTDGGDGGPGTNGETPGNNYAGGEGQGHTTRDFGEAAGKRNAGGGDAARCKKGYGISDYTEGKGEDGNYSNYGGGGYGGGGAGVYGNTKGKNGGDGTVLIRYYSYE